MLLECHHHLFALFFLYATCWIFQKLSTYKSEDCCCYRGRNSYFKRDKTARCEQIISVDKRRWCMLYKSRTICSALLHFALFHPQHFCCVWLRNHFIQFIHFALKKYLKCLNKKFLSCFYFSYVLLFNTYNLNTMTFNRAKLLISIHTFIEECFLSTFTTQWMTSGLSDLICCVQWKVELGYGPDAVVCQVFENVLPVKKIFLL